MMKKIYFLLLLIAASASGQNVNIPDFNFKSLLVQSTPNNYIAFDLNGAPMAVDANADGEIQVSEALLVYEFVNYGWQINNYTGLQAFVNLRRLVSTGGNATSINLNALTNLETLELSGSALSGINVAPLAALKELTLYGQTIGNMNFSGNTALEKLKLGGCGMTALNVSALVNLHVLDIETNNISTIDLSQNVLLDSLKTNQNPIAALNVTMLPNLKALQCSGNDLMALNISQNPQLTYLDMSTNEIPAMDFSSNTQLKWLMTYNNPMPVINLSMLPLLELLYVQNMGLANLDIANSPLIYQLDCSQNNLTQIDVSHQANLQAMFCHDNNLGSLDVSNNPLLNALECSGNAGITTLDISNNPVMCLFTANNLPNLETVFMKNGPAGCPFETQLQNSPALAYVCTDEEEIAYFTQTLPATVSISSYCNFEPGGPYNTISGTVLFDLDGNGCDAQDLAQPFVKVSLNDGTEVGAAFSNGNGAYDFLTGAGTFTLNADIENPAFFTINPATATVNFPNADGSVQNQSFCISANGTHHDVEVVLSPIIIPRPGFAAQYKIVYRNKGNQVENGVITFGFASAFMQLTATTQAPSAASTGQYTFDYSNLMPFETREIQLDFLVNAPTATPPVNIGDLLDFVVSITNTGTDETPNDNLFNLIQTVVGSFDPNDITCLEGAVVAPVEIGEYLHYLIRFENTGTFPAENIVVKTEIDPADYQVQSLQVLNASNPMQVRVNGNTAEYIFKQIDLGIGGHGNILLKIRSNQNLNTGSMVRKRADIYFDYNFPVDTGNAETVFQTLSVKNQDQDASILVYPNPVQDVLRIKADSGLQSLELYDVQGRILQRSLVDGKETQLDLSSRGSGMYLLKVTSEKGAMMQKIIKD